MAECLNFSNALSELRQPFHCNIRITNKCNFLVYTVTKHLVDI